MKKIIATGISILMLNISGLVLGQGYGLQIESEFKSETQGIVLLKNHGGLLPIGLNEINSIALIGPTIYYTGAGNELGQYEDMHSFITPLHGITKRVGSSINILASVDTSMKAVEKAREADIAIVFVGKPQRGPGPEAYYDIPEQSHLVKAIFTANPNTIVILQTDSAINIEDWAFDVPAIIQAWTPEEKSGREIAKVLFGDVNPQGRIPFTWSMNKNQNYNTRYAFGHGLSYGNFGIGKLMMRRDRDGNGWIATVETRNLGTREGIEMLQLYVRQPKHRNVDPHPELKAFKSVTLLPGQKKTVSVHMPNVAFEFFNNDKNAWTIEPGMYEILVGTSAEEIKLRKTIEIKESYLNQ